MVLRKPIPEKVSLLNGIEGLIGSDLASNPSLTAIFAACQPTIPASVGTTLRHSRDNLWSKLSQTCTKARIAD